MSDLPSERVWGEFEKLLTWKKGGQGRSFIIGVNSDGAWYVGVSEAGQKNCGSGADLREAAANLKLTSWEMLIGRPTGEAMTQP